MVWGALASVVARVAPSVARVVAAVAPKIVSAASSVASKISSGVSGLVTAAPAATKANIAGNVLKTGIAVGGAVIGSAIAGGSSAGRAAIGTSIAYATGGPISAVFVGGSALINNVKTALSGNSAPSPAQIPHPIQQSVAQATGNQYFPGTPTPFTNVYKPVSTNQSTSIGQVQDTSEPISKEPINALQEQVQKIKEDLNVAFTTKITDKISVGDVAKVAGAAALIAGGSVVAAKVYKSSKKKKKKKTAAHKKVFGVRTKKRKPAKKSKSKSKSKLKFGSPAWRKKYMKKKTKTGKKTKGHNPFFASETGGKNLGQSSKVGTEAQYSKKGGAKVYHTSKGQPYIIGATGKARFIKKSK